MNNNIIKIGLIKIKGILHFFGGEIGSFYLSPRVNQLSFTVFRCIQSIF